jgi:hypothetical protein
LFLSFFFVIYLIIFIFIFFFFRIAESFMEAIKATPSLIVFPTTRVTTYKGGNVESTLDFWTLSSTVLDVLSVEVGPWTSCQHRPLEIQAEVTKLMG